MSLKLLSASRVVDTRTTLTCPNIRVLLYQLTPMLSAESTQDCTSAFRPFFMLLTTEKLMFRISAKGRAYPDVSAQAQNFQVIIGGRTSNVRGTSASAPVSNTFHSSEKNSLY